VHLSAFAADVALIKHVHLVLQASVLALAMPQVQGYSSTLAVTEILGADQHGVRGLPCLANNLPVGSQLAKVAEVRLLVEDVPRRPSTERVHFRMAKPAAFDVARRLHAVRLVAPAMLAGLVKAQVVFEQVVSHSQTGGRGQNEPV